MIFFNRNLLFYNKIRNMRTEITRDNRKAWAVNYNLAKNRIFFLGTLTLLYSQPSFSVVSGSY